MRLKVRRSIRGGRPAIDELTVVTIDPGTSTNDTKIGLKAFSGVPTMPAVITRAQWGADESLMTWDPEYASTVKAAAIHHRRGRPIQPFHPQRIDLLDSRYRGQGYLWRDPR